ncbi:MAG: hypothetical protein QNI95_12115 [Desulfobacterales bacterium]|nr:hypothetical protein [Desulfobacterales bacterium]
MKCLKSLSEKLDPEEIKAITGEIFSELTEIIEKYDGLIEAYVGDAQLAGADVFSFYVRI